jgi:hypothetical protein
MNKPDDCRAECYLLLQVLKEEYEGDPGALIARFCYDAFQISITHGDQARAILFAERGFQSRVMCEGEDSPETRKIKNLIENQSRHRNFGASKRWKTAKRLVPKGLDTSEFEKWLWRRGRYCIRDLCFPLRGESHVLSLSGKRGLRAFRQEWKSANISVWEVFMKCLSGVKIGS